MNKKMLPLFLLLVLTCFIALPSLAIVEKPTIEDLVKSNAEDIVKVGENLMVGQDQTINSAVAIGGNLLVAGKILQDAVAIGGNVDLRKTAAVIGDVVAIGGKITKEEGAKVSGSLTEINHPVLGGAITTAAKGGIILMSILGIAIFIGVVCLCAVIAAIFTKEVGVVGSKIERNPWKMLGLGILFAILILPALLLLILSIIGIAFAPLFILAVIAAALLGFIGASQVIGKIVLKAVRMPGKPLVFEVILGAVLIGMISWVPFIGWLFKAILMLMGFGAATVTYLGTKR